MLAYLNCKYAQKLVLRRKSGNAQPKINVGDITYIPIPIFSPILENRINSYILKSKELIESSNFEMKDAEQILLKEIGILNWKYSTNSITQKNFLSLSNNLRLDSEYYQPKYDELFDKLKEYNIKPLSKIVDIDKSIEPGSEAYKEKGIPFIRVANLTTNGITDTNIYLSPEKYKDVIRPRKDTILLSKDGSVGIAYKVEKDMDIITSGAILHLKVIDENVMPDYLTLVLNSIVVKMQADRDAGGSVIQHWKLSEIENVAIPVLRTDIQQKIADKVRYSFMLRTESELLLNMAKESVEIAIEQGENQALELLKTQL